MPAHSPRPARARRCAGRAPRPNWWRPGCARDLCRPRARSSRRVWAQEESGTREPRPSQGPGARASIQRQLDPVSCVVLSNQPSTCRYPLLRSPGSPRVSSCHLRPEQPLGVARASYSGPAIIICSSQPASGRRLCQLVGSQKCSRFSIKAGPMGGGCINGRLRRCVCMCAVDDGRCWC